MQKKPYKTTIIGLSTDPYNNIYGYSLVFFRLFDFVERKNKNIDSILISNNGVSSTIVKNHNFKLIKINQKMNVAFKTLFLIYQFVNLATKYDNNAIIIANCELPELIAAWILKFKYKKVYGVIQDDRIRKGSIYTTIVCKMRILLLYAIKDVIFTNHYTMTRFNNGVNKYYIGNPIFY